MPVKKLFRKFLRFEFQKNVYEFTCLPFGLNIAPLIFTKLTKPVAKCLRLRGCNLMFYLDHILIIGETIEKCRNSLERTKHVLSSLGFLINFEKSNVTPSQELKYLGFIFNTAKLTVNVPQETINNIARNIKLLSQKKRCKIRKFASLVGKLVAIGPAHVYNWLHIKSLEIEKIKALRFSRGNFNATMIIPRTLQSEFR